MLYNIQSMRYRDFIISGPPNADLSELEEQWAQDHDGSVCDFVQWLVSFKGFSPPETVKYSFSRG